MTSSTAFVIFDFPLTHHTIEVAALARLLSRLVDQAGFAFADVPQLYQLPDSLATAQTVLAHQHATTPEYFLVQLRNDDDFDLSVAVSHTHPQRLFLLLENSELTTPHPRRVANLRTFVTACTITYHSMQPLYGYGLLTPNSYDDHILDSTEIPRCIYDYNFFSPALVAQIDRAKLCSASAWRTVLLQDGGILLEMAESPLTDIPHAHPRYEQTAHLLGAKYIRQGL